MKIRIVAGIFLAGILLSSCVQQMNPVESIPTIQPSLSPTVHLQAQLTQKAVLFSGPGNIGYTKLAELEPGDEVTRMGQFGDFIKVKTLNDQEGYVILSTLTDLRDTIPNLTTSEVPWQDLDLRYNLVGDGGTVTNNEITISDINGNGTGIGNGRFTPGSSFWLRMGLRLENNSGEYASVLLMGTPPVMEGDWWRGLIRLDVGVNQQDQLQICIRDGSSDQCNYEKWLDIQATQPFTLLFSDPQGKTLVLKDEQEREILSLDVTQLAGVHLPDGLFPTRAAWLGAWVNPGATLSINPFMVEKEPSGKAYLVNTPELDKWVDDYIHAYNGTVLINGVGMDSSTLTKSIRENIETYVQEKQINGTTVSYLVINNVPLAIQQPGEPWRKITGRDLADELKIDLAMPGLYSDIADPDNRKILANANMLNFSNDLLMSVVFKDFTAADWRRVLDQWEVIKTGFDSGTFPPDFPYYWVQADPVFLFAQSHQMKVRAQTLLCSGDCIPDSVYRGNFSKDEVKKLLEFTVSVTVLRNMGKVDEWTIENEQVIADLNKAGNEKYGFWAREIGLVPSTELVARTVKKLDPESKLIIAEAFLVEDQVGTQEPAFRQAFFTYLDELHKQGVPVDGVDIENGVWVYNPPRAEFEKEFLKQITDRGLYLSAPETIVVLTPDRLPFWYEPVIKTATVTDPLKSQAEVFSQIVQTYLDVGAKAIGFGDVGDKWSFVNYLGAPDANPSLFDDQSQPKQAYYEVMKVLYEYLP